jgi:hypothetical protein
LNDNYITTLTESVFKPNSRGDVKKDTELVENSQDIVKQTKKGRKKRGWRK